MACTYLEDCPFFNDKLDSKPATATAFKNQYCRSEFRACARYKVAESIGSENVPTDLYPNQANKVNKLLGNG